MKAVTALFESCIFIHRVRNREDLRHPPLAPATPENMFSRSGLSSMLVCGNELLRHQPAQRTCLPGIPHRTTIPVESMATAR